MKIYIANRSEQQLGGGFTFIRNLRKAIGDKVDFVDNIEDCDICFIAGSSMTDVSTIEYAKSLDKKIILRVDNALKDSRNRGCGMSRFKRMAELADKIVYQSKWSRDYLAPFLNKDGAVIMNGCDQEIFRPDGSKIESSGKIYLYTRFNRDETKCWHEAWYEYQMIQRQQSDAQLWIVGQFSDELREYNFDFFNGEKIKYWGVVSDPSQMAMIYRSAEKLIYPYFNDACSNTLIEARSCGTKIHMTRSGDSGGTPEILNKKIDDLGLEKMGEKYLKMFYEVSPE